MQFKIFNKEVFYPNDHPVTVSALEISFLKETSQTNVRRRARLCTHENVADALHEMIIVHNRGAYIRPHKHLSKVESIHLIEGTADLLLFDDDGGITSSERLGDYSSGLPFYNRISEPCYHTLLIRSEILVFHEVTNGPFIKSDSLFAPWSPEDADKQATMDYLLQLSKQVEGFTTGPDHH